MSRRVIDLSHDIEEGMLTYPVHWHLPVEITQLGRFGIEDRETRKVTMGTHTGTHFDAPRHFVQNGATVEQVDVGLLIGPSVVLDFSAFKTEIEIDPEMLKKALKGRKPERLVLRFDWDRHWGSLAFYQNHPYLSVAAAQYLIEIGVRVLLMDTPQVDCCRHGRGSGNDSPIHKLMLGANVYFVECLKNLSKLTRDEVEIAALPIKLKGCDGAWVRCVAIES